MTEKERDVLKKTIGLLDKYGVYYIRILHASKSGIPDIVCCINGAFIALECKSMDGEQSALQVYNERAIAGAGGAYITIYPYDLKDLESMLIKQQEAAHA